MRMRTSLLSVNRTSPIGALVRGILAGMGASLVQNMFFKATARYAPSGKVASFVPPEAKQQDEMPTETVMRRFVELFMQRGPLSEPWRKRSGAIVHYSFGSMWGAVYGLLVGTWPRMRGAIPALGFGTAVWAISDNGILPAFRLAAGPLAYPAKNHLYALAAHWVYGLGVVGVYRAMQGRAWVGVPLALRHGGRSAMRCGALWSIRRKARSEMGNLIRRARRNVRPMARAAQSTLRDWGAPLSG